MNSYLLQSTFLANGPLDPMTAEMTLLDAVFLAETIDHANWSSFRDLTMTMDEGGLRDAFLAAVDEVEDEEDEHVGWARETRATLTLLQAHSSSADCGRRQRPKSWLRESGTGSQTTEQQAVAPGLQVAKLLQSRVRQLVDLAQRQGTFTISS